MIPYEAALPLAIGGVLALYGGLTLALRGWQEITYRWARRRYRLRRELDIERLLREAARRRRKS